MINLEVCTGVEAIDSKTQNCAFSQHELELDIYPGLDGDAMTGGAMTPSHDLYQAIYSATARIYDEETDKTIEEWSLTLRFADFRMESDPNGAGMRLLATYAITERIRKG